MTHSRKDVVALLEAHGLAPSRALGQNFVVDPNTVRRIARLAAVGSGDHVIEIGPGLGSLTLALVETGARLDVVEVDRYIVPVLRDILQPHGVGVYQGDALTFDFGELTRGEPATVVANLPYNVATPLVLRLLEECPDITRLVVMVQREVGERLAAHASEEAYGAVSVRVEYFAEARVIGSVPPTVFHPRPKVDSALVELRRRPRVAIDPVRVSEDAIFTVVRQSFSQRRKMIRRSLADWATEGVFERAGLTGTERPEDLTLDQFATLAESR